MRRQEKVSSYRSVGDVMNLERALSSFFYTVFGLRFDANTEEYFRRRAMSYRFCCLLQGILIDSSVPNTTSLPALPHISILYLPKIDLL